MEIITASQTITKTIVIQRLPQKKHSKQRRENTRWPREEIQKRKSNSHCSNVANMVTDTTTKTKMAHFETLFHPTPSCLVHPKVR